MYVLYGGPFTRAFMVEMVLAEGDIAYELRMVDIVRQEHRTEAFLKINPAGYLPVMVAPDGEVLYETPALNLYLAERHAMTHLAPRVDEPQRGLFLSGLFYLAGDLEPVLKRYFYPHRYVLREEDIPAMKTRSLEVALERLTVIEHRLRDKGPYHLGERFSLVDLTMAYWTASIQFPGLLVSHPAISRCAKLVMDRPKLREMFDTLKLWRYEYAQMQARGAGVT